MRSSTQIHVKNSQAYVPILVAALLPLFGSFMSWGLLNFDGAMVSDMFAEMGIEGPDVDSPLGAGTYSINVWRSESPLFGVKLPNWITVAVAAVIAVLAAFGWQQTRTPYYSISVLATYGGLHTAYWIYKTYENPGLKPGVGCFVALIGFVVVLLAWLKLPAYLRA